MSKRIMLPAEVVADTEKKLKTSKIIAASQVGLTAIMAFMILTGAGSFFLNFLIIAITIAGFTATRKLIKHNKKEAKALGVSDEDAIDRMLGF